jgi:hypothetical protein
MPLRRVSVIYTTISVHQEAIGFMADQGPARNEKVMSFDFLNESVEKYNILKNTTELLRPVDTDVRARTRLLAHTGA